MDSGCVSAINGGRLVHHMIDTSANNIDSVTEYIDDNNNDNHRHLNDDTSIDTAPTNNLTVSIFSLPVEIIFHIFDIHLTNQNSRNHHSIIGLHSLDLKDNSSHRKDTSFKSSIFDSIQKFSMTCKYFYYLFQDQSFWLKSYKSFFSYYSMVDLDKRCLSLDDTSNSNNNIENINNSNHDDNNDSKILTSPLVSLEPQDISWKKRFFNRHHPWDYENIKCKKEIVGYHSLGITSLEVDDNYLYSGSHDSNINIYGLEDLKLITTLSGHKYTIWALKSDGDRYLYSGSNDQTLRVWDLKKNKCKSVIKDTNKIFSIALKEKLLFGTSENSIKVYNKKDLTHITTLSGHNGGVNKIFVNDNKLYSGSSDRSVRVWDLNRMACTTTKTDDSTSKVLSMTMMDENTLITGSQNCQIKIWDLRQDLPVQCLYNVHKWDVWQLEMCGGYLFSGSFDHMIKIWDPRNFENLKTIHGHRSYIHALASSSFHLFSGSADKHIRVWSDK